MKKISWATHKSLFGQIATSSCLLAVSAGVVFGVSAGTFKIQYFKLNDSQARLQASIANNYYSQNIGSQWNMYEKKDAKGEVTVEGNEQPYDSEVKNCGDWWKKTYGNIPKWNEKEPERDINPTAFSISTPRGTKIDSTAQEARKKYSTLVIDGATHTALDRSFNQSLYNGIANFVTNVPHDVKAENEGIIYKPAQDSTQEFVNIYRKAAEKTKVLCLAGFNHVTPLNALGKQKGALYKFDDKNIEKTGMLLIDGDVTNNQNIASVLFRSDQPAFLTALATCMYFYNNLDIYHENFKDISVAAYGGTAIPTVTVYMGGFQRGIEFFNHFILKGCFISEGATSYMNGTTPAKGDYFVEKMLPASKYKEEVEKIKKMPDDKTKQKAIDDMQDKLYEEYSIKMIKLGAFGTHFSGSFAAGDAIGISKQYLNRGASAIIAVAGPQSLDSVQEVMNQNKSCIVIGVDCAMENSDYQKPFKNNGFKDKTKDANGKQSAQAGNIMKFSAVKDMTTVSDKILRLAAEGKNWDVDNSSPWKSPAQIPTWKPEEEYKLEDLSISYDEPRNTFDVLGFSTQGSTAYKRVLAIPATIEKDKRTYYLNKIGGTQGTYEKFSGATLKNTEILAIKGKIPKQRQVIFLDKAFDFTQDDTAGFRYIDLHGVDCEAITVDTNAAPFGYMAQNPSSKVRNKGVIKLGSGLTDNIVKKTYESLIKDINNHWPLTEADPTRSICSFGFKTCGNIENGLISISWDGWAPLIDCLRHLKGIAYPAPLTEGKTFMEIWKEEADLYIKFCTKYEIPLSEEFKSLVQTSDWEKLYTFDRESPLCKEYSHVMAILGRVLKNGYITFPKNMTLIPNEDTGVPSILTSDVSLSILDWLRYNMYFIV